MEVAFVSSLLYFSLMLLSLLYCCCVCLFSIYTGWLLFRGVATVQSFVDEVQCFLHEFHAYRVLEGAKRELTREFSWK